MRVLERRGIVLFPVSFLGWIIAAAAAVFLVYSCVDIDSHSHSVSDSVRNWVFMAVIVWAAYSVIGFLLSTKREKVSRLS